MNFRLFILRFHPLASWTLKGIPRGVYPIYKMWKKENPDVTEKELANALFNRRFSTTVFESAYQEKTRIKSYFEKNADLENLIDMCVASAMVEIKIPSENKKTHRHIKKIIATELFKLGYRQEFERESF